MSQNFTSTFSAKLPIEPDIKEIDDMIIITSIGQELKQEVTLCYTDGI